MRLSNSFAVLIYIIALVHVPLTLALPKNNQLTCGSKHNDTKCPEDLCCSSEGRCTADSKDCRWSDGCQPKFGRCTGEKPKSASQASQPALCGPSDGPCPPGTCCSTAGVCGVDADSCLISRGCQSEFGTCLPPDGLCGPNNSFQQCTVLGWCCGGAGICGTDNSSCSPDLGCIQECRGSSSSQLVVTVTVTSSQINTATSDVIVTSTPLTSTATMTTNMPFPTVNTDEEGVCGPEFGNRACAEGSCCSKWGWCGYSNMHCMAPNCVYQCSDGSSIDYSLNATNFSEELPCGPSSGNATCPEGNCCSIWGFCGNSELHCQSPNCLYQCGSAKPKFLVIEDVYRCGPQFENSICPDNLCCSKDGYCGMTVDYCRKPNCVSNCWP